MRVFQPYRTSNRISILTIQLIMKKLFLALVLCLFTSTAFCGAPTCRVYGTNGVVATLSKVFGPTDKPQAQMLITVSITEAQTKNISVVVEATQDGNFVGSCVVTIPVNHTGQSGEINLNSNYNKNGGRVNVNIASASCQ